MLRYELLLNSTGILNDHSDVMDLRTQKHICTHKSVPGRCLLHSCLAYCAAIMGC
jgi:hypothetical protein